MNPLRADLATIEVLWRRDLLLFGRQKSRVVGSWHPVPVMIHSKFVRPDHINQFGERACQHGSLGVLPATQIMPIALANAGRIAKYGG